MGKGHLRCDRPWKMKLPTFVFHKFVVCLQVPTIVMYMSTLVSNSIKLGSDHAFRSVFNSAAFEHEHCVQPAVHTHEVLAFGI